MLQFNRVKARFLVPALMLFTPMFPCLGADPVPSPFVTGQGDKLSFRSFEDDAGGFYLAWTLENEKNSITLLAQHLSSDGHPLWNAPGMVVSSSLISSENWSGSFDGQGGLSLFWDESDGVHVQRFRPDGSRQRPGESVLLSTSSAIQPDAVADASGGTLVVWRETLPGGRPVIMAQRLNAEDQPLWPDGGLRVCLRASSQTNPRLVYDNMSGMVVAWRDEAYKASELRMQRIDFSGNRLWSLEGLKISAPVGVSEYPTLASLGTGGAVVAWMAPVNQTTQILLQRVGPEPLLKWSQTTYSSSGPATYNRWNPVLLGDDQGGTWVGWEDYRTQVNYQIELNHLDGKGLSVWPGGEIAIAPAQGDQGKMTMVRNDRGGVWVAWIDNRRSTVGVYVQEVDASGQRHQGSGGHLISDQLRKPFSPELVPLGPGKAAVIWADRPKKNQWALSWVLVGTPK